MRAAAIFLLCLPLVAAAQDADSNLKPPPDVAAAALEAYRFGLKLLDEYDRLKDRSTLDRAIEEFQKAERVAGKPFALATYCLGIALHRNDDFREARRKLERCLELNPAFHEAMSWLADTHARLRSPDAALKMYDRAIATKPLSAYHRGKGVVYLKTTDFAAALKCFDEAVKLDPNDASAASYRKIAEREIAGPQFKQEYRRETAHFVIVSNVTQGFTDYIGRHIELITAKYQAVFPDGPKSRDKCRVILFEREQEYLDDGGPPRTAGYYHDLTKKLAFWEQKKNEDTLLVLYHETFHQYLASFLDHAPEWFNEGLADYFAGAQVDEATRRVEIRPNRWRLGQVKSYKGLRRLMLMTRDEMYDPDERAENYAEAWAIVYFLVHGQGGKYQKLLLEYFRFLCKEEDRKGAFDAVFGKLDLKKMEDELRLFIGSLR